MSQQENASPEQPSSSSGIELEDLNFLNFPPDIDWSTTLVIRCDPAGAPYKLIDVANALHFAVHRSDVFNLGPTALNYAFIISFKTERSTENFVRYLKDSRNRPLTVKNKSCLVTRIPSRCVTICVRWIPADIDTSHIVNELKEYGTIVKCDMVKNVRQGWFHVYTGERKIKVLLKEEVDVNSLPFSLDVKGLFASTCVMEREPKCLDCYYNGHQGDTCEYKGCILYKET